MPNRERNKREVPDTDHAQKFKNQTAAKSSTLISVVTLFLAGVLSGQALAVAVRAPVLAMADKPFERSQKLSTFTNVSQNFPIVLHTTTQHSTHDAANHGSCYKHRRVAVPNIGATDPFSNLLHSYRNPNGRDPWTREDTIRQPEGVQSMQKSLARWKDRWDHSQREEWNTTVTLLGQSKPTQFRPWTQSESDTLRQGDSRHVTCGRPHELQARHNCMQKDQRHADIPPGQSKQQPHSRGSQKLLYTAERQERGKVFHLARVDENKDQHSTQVPCKDALQHSLQGTARRPRMNASLVHLQYNAYHTSSVQTQ